MEKELLGSIELEFLINNPELIAELAKKQATEDQESLKAKLALLQQIADATHTIKCLYFGFSFIVFKMFAGY